MTRTAARSATQTSAYRIGLALSGGAEVYYSGLFASRRQLELALAERFRCDQDATYLLDMWPFEVAVLEHHRGGELRARVELAQHLRARLSDGRRIELGEDDLEIEGIADRHDAGHDDYLELLDGLATGQLQLQLEIEWDEIDLGDEGPPLGSRVKALRLANGFEHPRGWIGGEDALDLRDRIDPGQSSNDDGDDDNDDELGTSRRTEWSGPKSVLLFSLAELPLAELLADVAEMSAGVREQTFFLARGPLDDVVFPPEADNDYDENQPGFRMLRILAEWFESVLPNTHGSWNHGSSRQAVQAAFERAGWSVIDLDSLARDRRSTSATRMIAALQAELGTGQLDPAEAAWVRYLASGGRIPDVDWTTRLLGRVALGVGKPVAKRLRERMTNFVLQGDGQDMRDPLAVDDEQEPLPAHERMQIMPQHCVILDHEQDLDDLFSTVDDAVAVIARRLRLTLDFVGLVPKGPKLCIYTWEDTDSSQPAIIMVEDGAIPAVCIKIHARNSTVQAKLEDAVRREIPHLSLEHLIAAARAPAHDPGALTRLGLGGPRRHDPSVFQILKRGLASRRSATREAAIFAISLLRWREFAALLTDARERETDERLLLMIRVALGFCRSR